MKVIFSRNCVMIWFIKCLKIVKDVLHTLPESKVTCSDFLFCAIKSPKPKDFQLIIIGG